MDRQTVNVAKAQVGYIDFIIKPSFDILSEILPMMNVAVDNAEQNKTGYAKLVDKFETQMTQVVDQATRSIENNKHKSIDTDDYDM